MKIVKPAYYDTFRCLASACPDSCCQEWAVQVDEDAAALYRALEGPLGDRLRSVMTEEDGDVILALEPDGRCPMWQQDGLCRIQAQLGEDALCHTCRMFPRLRHDYGDLVELGLELSCPEAARLILADDGSMITESAPGGEEPEYDTEAMDILLRTREVVLHLLSSPTAPEERLAVLLLYGYAVQEELDGGEPAQLQFDSMLATARNLSSLGQAADLPAFFKTLEILTPRWENLLRNPTGSSWCDAHLAMARYFVNRYWLQAVSDYDLISRVKLTVASCLLVKQLGGNLQETAQLYSKEIENNADNVDAILDGAYTSPLLTDMGLLKLLLEA